MSSPISKENLEHLASLARINLTKAEEEKFLGDLEAILNYFEELKSIDTSNVPPMTGGTFNRGIFREDEASESTNQGAGKDQFPDKKDYYLKVPKIF